MQNLYLPTIYYILSTVWWIAPGWNPGALQSHSYFSASGEGRRNITKDSWVKIRTGRYESPVTITGKTDLTWGKINLLPIKLEKGNEKQNQILK